MHIITGLGNPGPKFDFTRHNIGFAVIDELARELGLSWREDKKFKALVAEGTSLLLVKPLTFMNLSGESVAAVLRYYKLVSRSLFGVKKDSDLTAVLTVIHDELDMPFGTFKKAKNSGSGGHNGIISIIDHLKTKNFSRLKIGIDIPNRRVIPSDKFVLQRFSPEELEKVKTMMPELLQAAKQ